MVAEQAPGLMPYWWEGAPTSTESALNRPGPAGVLRIMFNHAPDGQEPVDGDETMRMATSNLCEGTRLDKTDDHHPRAFMISGL